MSSSDLVIYDLTIPIFTKRIEQLSHYIKKSEQWCKDNSKPPASLLEARIFPDMQPLAFQVRTCYRMIFYLYQNLHIAESHLPAELPEGVNTLEELYDQLDEMTTVLEAAKPEDFAGKRDMVVKFGPPGREPWEFTGLSFVQEFLLVNFMFHATTAYNILRMQGVPLGKMDFIGKTGNQ